ncbi:hypothetical protein [Falsiroseomonas selenitidurans]|uniref:Quinol:cytochrome c oxidoreductase quinone-binding subunit 2 n=1 Tax=Falsiroseomonas selenitidurans TaxID=2716335 RepID=A0ABX1E6N8_9PROT|nr:hypothetical protein [Falsiroseomonas selenitidurans]NKC32855.1 hypothetical protein [Falsiroseomonas selenitidurans]
MRVLPLLLAALAAVSAATLGGAALAEAWLPALLLLAQLAVGAIGILALGHLLGEAWLAPVRAPLEAAARTVPLVALLALPVLLGLAHLYPWAAGPPPEGPIRLLLQPWAFQARAAACLAVWAALGWGLARPGRHPRVAALALALLLPTTTLASFDWVLSRDITWYASLQGFSLWVEGLAAALAAAILAAPLLGRAPAESQGMPGLERALLTLGLAVLWLWFTQFIVVWMADRPEESAWYLRRLDDWGWVQLGLALPALLAAIALAAPPDHGRRRMAAVCWLLLVQHGAHLWWVVRPDAPVASPAPALDLAVAAGLGLLWGAGVRAAIARDPPAARASGHGSPPPATG